MWNINELDYWLWRLKRAIEDSFNYIDIKDFPDYKIRVDGKVKNKHGKIVTPFWIHGQKYINLYKDGKQHKLKLKQIYNNTWN